MKSQSDDYRYIIPSKNTPHFYELLRKKHSHLYFLQFRVVKIKTAENTQVIYSRLILYNFGIFIANEAAEENRKKKRDGSNKYLYEYPSFWHTCFWLFEFKISDIRQQLGYRTKLQTTGLMALPLEYSRLIFSIYFHDNQQLNLLLLLLPSLDMLHSKKFRYKYC